MSEVTKKDIEKIAKLSRIRITDDESEAFASQVGNIINWVEQLNEVNTDNVEIMTNVSGIDLRLNEDKVADGGISEDILSNAKNPLYGYFSVPKVIE